MDRKESNDSLLAEAIRQNDDLKVLEENIELVSEHCSSKVVIDPTSSSPGMPTKVPDALSSVEESDVSALRSKGGWGVFASSSSIKPGSASREECVVKWSILSGRGGPEPG